MPREVCDDGIAPMTALEGANSPIRKRTLSRFIEKSWLGTSPTFASTIADIYNVRRPLGVEDSTTNWKKESAFGFKVRHED